MIHWHVVWFAPELLRCTHMLQCIKLNFNNTHQDITRLINLNFLLHLC